MILFNCSCDKRTALSLQLPYCFFLTEYSSLIFTDYKYKCTVWKFHIPLMGIIVVLLRCAWNVQKDTKFYTDVTF